MERSYVIIMRERNVNGQTKTEMGGLMREGGAQFSW